MASESRPRPRRPGPCPRAPPPDWAARSSRRGIPLGQERRRTSEEIAGRDVVEGGEGTGSRGGEQLAGAPTARPYVHLVHRALRADAGPVRGGARPTRRHRPGRRPPRSSSRRAPRADPLAAPSRGLGTRPRRRARARSATARPPRPPAARAPSVRVRRSLPRPRPGSTSGRERVDRRDPERRPRPSACSRIRRGVGSRRSSRAARSACRVEGISTSASSDPTHRPSTRSP